MPRLRDGTSRRGQVLELIRTCGPITVLAIARRLQVAVEMVSRDVDGLRRDLKIHKAGEAPRQRFLWAYGPPAREAQARQEEGLLSLLHFGRRPELVGVERQVARRRVVKEKHSGRGSNRGERPPGGCSLTREHTRLTPAKRGGVGRNHD